MRIAWYALHQPINGAEEMSQSHHFATIRAQGAANTNCVCVHCTVVYPSIPLALFRFGLHGTSMLIVGISNRQLSVHMAYGSEKRQTFPSAAPPLVDLLVFPIETADPLCRHPPCKGHCKGVLPCLPAMQGLLLEGNGCLPWRPW